MVYSIQIGSLPENDLVFDEPMVSSRHAEILFDDGELTLVDLNSTNGTYVGRERISRRRIEPGQEIGLGSFHFRLTQAHLRPLYEKVMRGREADAEQGLLLEAPIDPDTLAPEKKASKSASVTVFEDAPRREAPAAEKMAPKGASVTVFEDAPRREAPAAKRRSSKSAPKSAVMTLFEDDARKETPATEKMAPTAAPKSAVMTLFEDDAPNNYSSATSVSQVLSTLYEDGSPAPKSSDSFTLFEAPAAVSLGDKASLQRTLPVGDLKAAQGNVRAITVGYHSSNTLSLPLPQVSGYHARLTQEGSDYFVTDLQSTNGTYVNGEQVIDHTPVKLGDLIGLGSYSFEFDDEILTYFDKAEAERALFDPSRWTEGDSERLTLGRAEDNDIVIQAPQISGHHAELRLVDADHWSLVDLGSLNGTYVNVRSTPVTAYEEILVSRQDVLFLGSYRFPMARISDFQVAQREDQSLKIPESKDVVVIGRGDDNDIVIDSPQISRVHAVLRRRDGGWFLEDVGSANGTFVNGERLTNPRQISSQDIVGFGSYMLRLDPDGGVLHKEYQGEIMLRAENVSVDVKDPKSPGGSKRILEGISFTAYPTEFIGLMGPSGAGKTTLMMALNGYLVPSEGQSFINDLDLYEHYNNFRGNIGYVPQDDIIHPELTVFESLYFTAKLRLPPDTTDQEIERLIDKILKDLGIFETKHVLIGSPLRKGISGGQRKRVNLAQELITQPSLLFLDEPTSGLASSDTRSVMKLLRRLADEGRTILLTIHQPSLEVYREMDNVLYLARGRLVYYGPTYPDSISYFNPEARAGTPAGDRLLSNPDEAMAPLAIDNAAADSMKRLEARQTAYESSKYHRDYVSGRRKGEGKVDIRSGTKQRATRRFGFRQWWTLTRRTLTIKRKDTVNSAILLLQAPIIAMIVGVVFDLAGSGGDDPVSQFFANQSAENINAAAIFMLVASSVWFGTSNAAREIVSELAIYRRERMVNLKIPSYVMSKFTALSLLSLIQCTALLGITYPWLDFHGHFLGMLGVLFLRSTAGLGIGLFLSALVRSSEAAVALVPLLLIPQLVLGGLIVPIEKLDGDSSRDSVRYGANSMVARWGFEGLLHLEQSEMPKPPPITLSQDLEKLAKILTWPDPQDKSVNVVVPPARRTFRKERKKFEDQARAFLQHYQAEALNKRQDEIKPLNRYFGRFSSSLTRNILILFAFNAVLLAAVCIILRVKDVEV